MISFRDNLVYASRPIPINKELIHRLSIRICNKIINILKSTETENVKDIIENSEISLSQMVKDVKEDPVLFFIFIQASPKTKEYSEGKLVIDGFITKNKKSMFININPKINKNLILKNKDKFSQQLYMILIHEFSHMSDVLKINDKDKDINSDQEMKAYIQQMFEEFMEEHDKAGVDFKNMDKSKRLKYIKDILSLTREYKERKDILNEKFIKNLYRVIYTWLMEE